MSNKNEPTLLPNESIEWVKYDGIEYYTRLYNPQDSPAVANLIIVHGFGEHSDRYEPLARHFCKNNFRVLAFDMKGFGRTGRKQGQLGGIGQFDKVYKQINHFANTLLLQKYSDTSKLFIYGHSMGGCIVLNYCAVPEYASSISAVISSAPALKVDPSAMPPAILVSVLKVVSRFLPSIPVSSNINPADLTSDPVELEKYKQSFYNYNLTNIGSAGSMLDEGDACRLIKAKSYTVPCMVVHGKGDKVTSSQGSSEFYDNLPASLDKKLIIHESNFHELHNEPDFKDIVFDQYLDWFKSHI
ncbi:putative abhydrolase domain-containing protein [Smittium culicis]|uniref:Putative abhydrolase domain-containing protein n=3 Tax=Smittium culicis TaxID=133412 RepID=A0A1R1YJZ0_9FUNG|nr:putative abhydrolase domain-containing protein [Smittium culicis]